MNLSRFLTIEGRTLSVKAWAKQPGAAAYHTIWWRLKKGVCARDAVFAAVHSKEATAADARGAALPVYQPRPRRAKAQTRVESGFRPTFGSFKSVPIEMLDTFRRLA